MWQNKLLTIGAETVIVPNVTVDKKLSTEMTNNKNTSPGNSSTSKKKQSIKVEQQPSNRAEYDEDMEKKIRMAHAMIAAQQIEQQSNQPKESNPFKKLAIVGVMLVAVIYVLFSYVKSTI